MAIKNTTKTVLSVTVRKPDALAKKLGEIMLAAKRLGVQLSKAEGITDESLNKQMQELIARGVSKLTPWERTLATQRFIHHTLNDQLNGEQADDVRAIIKTLQEIANHL